MKVCNGKKNMTGLEKHIILENNQQNLSRVIHKMN